MRNLMIILLAAWLVMLCVPVYADGCRGNCDEGGPNNAEAEAEANAHAEGGHGGEGGDGGDAASSSDSVSNADTDVQVKNESTSLVLSGARDTAECFTKVTIGAEGFGIGFSRKDKYCRKVRRIAVHLERENWDAAARLECTLPEWKEVYGDDTEACVKALDSSPEETTSYVPTYDEPMMAQVSQEEFEEQQELVEQRFAQYENLVDNLVKQHADDDAEIERLKREAAELRAAEEKRAARRAAVLKKLQEDENGKEPDSK